jgi:tetratricopeptide (TPR) repeat protein
LGLTLLDQGEYYLEAQDVEAAERSFTEALQIFQELDNPDRIVAAQEALGRLALQTARPAQAQALLKEARQHYTTLAQPDRVEAIDDLLRGLEPPPGD